MCENVYITVIFLVFVLTIFSHKCTCSPWLHMGTDGYKGLIIAVHPSVPEQKQFVDRLQNLVASASSALYRATSSKFFFEEVVIVLPSTWTRDFHSLPNIGDVFSHADVRVYGNGEPALPYSVQYSDCERQGRYIQITSQFVQSSDKSTGEILMQEFARYRYGIFDALNSTEDSTIPVALKVQGFRCDGQNKWDVLTNHPDSHQYKEMMNADKTGHHYHNYEPATVFKLYRTQPKETYMLIFDVSRTLWDKAEYASIVANLTLEKLVREFLPDGSQVGFITFSNSVNIMRGLTQLYPQVKKTFFQGSGVKVSGTKQALANAIAKAAEVLKENHLGSKIIVVTDGNNDVAPPIENIIPVLSENMISVSVLTPSIRHETNLKPLVTQTGGHIYFLGTDWFTSIKMQTSMLDSLISNSRDIQVCNEEIVISHNMTYRVTVHIDAFLGEKTQFKFEGEHLNETGINIFLASFSGAVYNLKNATRHGKTIQFSVNDEPGNWTILFANPARLQSKIHFRVTSRARRTDLKLALFDSWLDIQRDVYYSTVRIFADLHKGPNAIIDANVTAVVQTSNGEEVAIVLRDTGTGADLTAKDGIYSAYFTKFNGDGIYTVLTRAESSKDTRTHGRVRDGAPEDGSKGIKEDYITRYKYAGTFTIQDYKDSMNKIPPGQVTDLEVNTNRNTTALTISWTAPGSDFDSGIVTRYDLRMGFKLEEDSEMNDIFKEWYSITASEILEGTLDPSPSGTKQKISISVPDILQKDRKIYCALRSQDVNGNPSKISNVAMFEIKVEMLRHVPPVLVSKPPVSDLAKTATTFSISTESDSDLDFISSSESEDQQSRETTIHTSVQNYHNNKHLHTVATQTSEELLSSQKTLASDTNYAAESDSPQALNQVKNLSTENTFAIQSDATEINSPLTTEEVKTQTIVTENTAMTTENVLNFKYKTESDLQQTSKEVVNQTKFTTQNVLTIEQEPPLVSRKVENSLKANENITDTAATTTVSKTKDHATKQTKSLLISSTEMSVDKAQKYNAQSPPSIFDGTAMSEMTTKMLRPVLNAKKPSANISSTDPTVNDTQIELIDSTSNDSSEIQNRTELEESNGAPNVSHNQMYDPEYSMVKKVESFNEVNTRTSTVIAAWVGGFCLTLVVIASIAMMVRSYTKRGKYDVSSMEDGANSTTQELICDDSTATLEDSF